MNHSTRPINDSHPATSSATSKDIYATWTPSAIKSGFEPSRHHRSASGYPLGPDYVSTSRRHAERPSSSRARNVSESQPPSTSSQTRYREPPHADTTHSHLHRKDIPPDPATHISTSRKYAHTDSTNFRQNYSVENAPQNPHVNYERWIPPNQPSLPTHQQEYRYRERDRYEKHDKEKQRQREEYNRDRRDGNDLREKQKRRYEEGDSDWDKERRDRREKERHRESERDKAKDQERERIKEEHTERAREKIVKEKTREEYRDEREQERYVEKERQRTVEKDREKERERERRRQKDKEREQDGEREKKVREKYDDPRERKDPERERKRERDLLRPEREYWREIEKGRESDREFDKRRKKGNSEQEKERGREKESSGKVDGRVDVPNILHEGRRRETEYDEARRIQDTTRKFPATDVEGVTIPLVVRDQEIERARRSKKDTNSPRQKEYEKMQKAGEQSEAEHARYADKENISRREHRTHEKMKRSGAGRSYADRVTDSERENPSHRDIAPSNSHLREPTLRFVESDAAVIISKSLAGPSRQLKDESDLHATLVGHLSNVTRTGPELIPTSTSTRAIVPTDGHASHIALLSRPIDQTLSITPEHSPVSAAGAESLKLDPGAPETKAKQSSSSQRALRRQSKMSSLIPDQIAVLPPIHTTNKHSQSQIMLSSRNDIPRPPSSYAFKSEKEGSARPYLVQAPINSVQQHNPTSPANQAVATKVDVRTNVPSTSMHRTISTSLNNAGSRSLIRNSNVLAQPPSSHDKPSADPLQVTHNYSRDAQGSSILEVRPPAERLLNDADGKSRTTAFPNQSSEYIVARPASRSQLDKMGKYPNIGIDTPASAPASPPSTLPPGASVASASVRPSSRDTTRPSNMLTTIIFDPEIKVIADKSRAVPQSSPLGTPPSITVTQENPKREGSSAANKVQNANEIPPRRPPSTSDWITPQEISKDKATTAPSGSYTNAGELVYHPFQRSSSVDSQPATVSSMQLASSSRRPPTGFYTHKQEGLISRVHTRTPIPEEIAVPASNRSIAQIDPSLQRMAVTSHRCSPPEHLVAPRMNLRSVSESVGVTPTPLIKTVATSASKAFSNENRKGVELHHTPNSISSENALPLPTGPLGDKSGHVAKASSQEDQLRPESFQSHSPVTSLHRETSVQPSSSRPPNAFDRSDAPQHAYTKSQSSNNSRSHTLAAKASEEIMAASHSRPSKPSEDTNRAMYGASGRSVGQIEANLPPPRDSHMSEKPVIDKTPGVVQDSEQGPMNTTVRGVPANDIPLAATTNPTVPSVHLDSGSRNVRYLQQTEHQNIPHTSLRSTVDSVAHDGNTPRRQTKEVVADKKPEPLARSHQVQSVPKEEQTSNYHDATVKQSRDDKKPVILHEGLARVLDQPSDRQIRKVRASPLSESSQSGLPREELNEVSVISHLPVSAIGTDLTCIG
ncbi:hypothetical protein AX15_003969 [Amanita polypyramis BW_CC]|nr:hypothetical protein AX15_003969 [Amanita polypyramis BW_CC]